jgi:NDP-sugar pyrophosphorylase family protein
MKALILAGGEGTRLRPLTLDTPKPVVPVGNIPFLCYQIELLRRHGIHEVILSLGYQPHKIEKVLGDGSAYGSRIHYVVEQTPLGTAGAYKNAESLLQEATVVLNGDILCDLDLSHVIEQHRSRNATATLVLTRVENPSAYGLVETESDGRITRFLEKPGKDEITCNTINAGTYILEPEVLQRIPAGENFSFERGVFPALLQEQRRVYAYISDGYWIDIGTPQKYLQVHQDILQGRFKPPFETDRLLGARYNQNSRSDDSVIDGGSILGSSAKLGKGVRIHSSCIGEYCRIGDHTVIENCVIWSNASIGESSHLTGCVLGNDCRVGRHTTLARGVLLGDGSVVTDYSSLPGKVD